MHGNIVQIFQLGEVGGDYFIAMEYIQGPTLRSIIDTHRDLKAPMPPTLAAYVASLVCRALDFAHNFIDARGRRLDIVHPAPRTRALRASLFRPLCIPFAPRASPSRIATETTGRSWHLNRQL